MNNYISPDSPVIAALRADIREVQSNVDALRAELDSLAAAIQEAFDQQFQANRAVFGEIGVRLVRAEQALARLSSEPTDPLTTPVGSATVESVGDADTGDYATEGSK